METTFLRVGVDGRPFRGRRAGIGRYAFELCQRLETHLPQATFFVYSATPVELPAASTRWALRTDPWHWARRLPPILWLRLCAGRLCRQDRLDVFWGAATFLPRGLRGVRTVSTVYDLNHEVVPQTMGRAHLWAHRRFYGADVARADRILAISRGTARRLLQVLGRQADAVVYPAVGRPFAPQAADRVQHCLAAYRIAYRYLLAVATWEPRKNLEVLISAFLQMSGAGELPGYRLVLVGGRGWKDRRLADLVGARGSEAIVPLGYVPDEHLPALYAGAEAFVFPSLYEGFGMPVLEARACGTRLVVSDIPELREAGGADALYVAPTAAGIQDGIRAALQQPRPAPFPFGLAPSWDDGARVLAAALRGELPRAAVPPG
ncbi:MAG: glycosyltransferase family 1 protein [Candidatus Latescibacterota bacterium]